MENGKKSILTIVISAIVTIILVLVVLLLIRDFKYMPSTTKDISKDIKKYQIKTNDYNSNLADDLFDVIDENGDVLNKIKKDQTKNYNNTINELNDVQTIVTNRIGDSQKKVTDAIKNSEESINNNVDSQANEINKNIKDSKEEIIDEVDNAKDEINDNIENAKDEINDNIENAKDEINDNINSAKDEIKQSMNTRFNQVDSSIDTLSTNLESDTNSIISELGTKSGEIKTYLTNIEGNLANAIVNAQNNLAGVAEAIQTNLANLINNNTSTLQNGIRGVSGNITDLFNYIEQINNNKIGSFADGSTIYSKLLNLGSMVYALNGKADTTKDNTQSVKELIGTYSDSTSTETLFGLNQLTLEKVKNVGNMVHQTYTNLNTANENITALSTIVGTQNDTSSDNTLFGKTNLVLEKVLNVGSMVYTINGKVDTANGKLDTVLNKLDGISTTATINDSTMTEIYNAVGATDATSQAQVQDVITWLKNHNYAK